MRKHNLPPIDTLVAHIDKRVAAVIKHDRRTIAARVLLKGFDNV